MIESILAKTENEIFEELLTEFIERNGYVPHKESVEGLTIKFSAEAIYAELKKISDIARELTHKNYSLFKATLDCDNKKNRRLL